MAGKEKGAWILGTRGTAWRLESAGITLVDSENEPEVIRQKVHAIENKKIIIFEPSYPCLALTLTFSNGYQLILVLGIEDSLNLPYWELFTPNQMLLKVGPGPMWSYIRSDLPKNQDT